MGLKLAIVNGPNLHWLGRREPQIYGRQSWQDIWKNLEEWAKQREILLTYFQSNSEGNLIDHFQEIENRVKGIIFNPAAYAHTSIALRDCVAALQIPVVEVHLSKTQKRESFRHHSYIADVCEACIVGFGAEGYQLGLELLKYLVGNPNIKNQISK